MFSIERKMWIFWKKTSESAGKYLLAWVVNCCSYLVWFLVWTLSRLQELQKCSLCAFCSSTVACFLFIIAVLWTECMPSPSTSNNWVYWLCYYSVNRKLPENIIPKIYLISKLMIKDWGGGKGGWQHGTGFIKSREIKSSWKPRSCFPISQDI